MSTNSNGQGPTAAKTYVILSRWKKRLDTCKRKAVLPNREEDLHYLIAEEYYPDIIEELFPDWVAKPQSASFCLVKESRS